MIQVALLDDHRAISMGIEALLKSSTAFELCFYTDQLSVFHAEIQMLKPSVLIMDVVMPDSVGLNAFQQTRDLFPELKIIAYTSLGNKTLVSMLLKLGVVGYVSKNDDPQKLLEALDVCIRGEIYLPPEYSSLKQKYSTPIQKIELSGRELEVLQALYEGQTSQEIADHLFISKNTVDTHRKNLFAKFNVNNMAQLIKEALQIGYLK